MNRTDRYYRLQQLLIRGVLVIIPTILIGYVTLRFLNLSYTSLNTGVASQTVSFAVGLAIAYALYYYRARWVVTIILLLVSYWTINRIITRLPGEFDVFYATARFQLYSTLFIFGWLFGFLLARLRWSYIMIFGLLATVTLVSVSDTVDVTLTNVILHITPVVLYGLYMLFITPLIATDIVFNGKTTVRLLWRTALFVVLVFLALLITANLFQGDLQAVEKELTARGAKNDKEGNQNGGGKSEDRNSLMEKPKGDDGYRLKDTMRVNSKMSSSDKLMFCAKLDNFFPDGSPAPLYFVYHYLTRYDSVRQSFTRDTNVPSFDEFDVDPVGLPMYYSIMDTSIIRKSMATKFRKVVEAQVYLSENTWKHSVLGPASVFAIQTIPVEKDFQKTFLSGYKINSFVSDLNNAYFVYNISANPGLEPLQEKRQEELRSVSTYNSVDRKFLKYYTQYPRGDIYDSIRKLALSLPSAGNRPVDKVIAVRDYFLKRNENGDRIFRYSLNAGSTDDPNIPSSKMLYNFLFRTHEGYCTYFAGASLFMLRALGIPTRFTTGFAAINRSDKNKGWYWFYASQAHAWTQVYFPEYGWIDFDMTIGNEDQQSAPKPDGTPPLPPPDPLYVLNAVAGPVDIAAKKLDVTFDRLLYLNSPYFLKRSYTLPVDATQCRILFNKRDTTFAAIQPGDSIIVISYKDDSKKYPKPGAGVSMDNLVTALPPPFVADEIHIRGVENEKKKDDAGGRIAKEKEFKLPWRLLAQGAGFIVLGLIAAVFLFPSLYLLYRQSRIVFAKGPSDKADQIYRSALYRFHMAGYERDNRTPLEYARNTIDPQLQTGFVDFMNAYLKLKYSKVNVSAEDKMTIDHFAKQIGTALRKGNSTGKRIINYLNILLALRYFQSPQKTDYETSLL